MVFIARAYYAIGSRMLRQHAHRRGHKLRLVLNSIWQEWSLQIVLWLLWSLAIIGVGAVSVRDDILAHRPINFLGLVIHCSVAGIIGLVILTFVEMHVEPWRFYDE